MNDKLKNKHMNYLSRNRFIIYETLAQNNQQSSNILQVSAAKQGATVKCSEEVCSNDSTKKQYVVYINDTVYGSAIIEQGKKETKVLAFENAQKYAKKIHYTIKVRLNFISETFFIIVFFLQKF